MNPNIEMLNYIYKNAQMGQNSINHLLDIIKDDSKFRNLLERQFKEYKIIFDVAETAINKMGHEAKGINSLKKFETYKMIDLKTINDKSSDHIAEMLIKGSTMGVIQLTRRIKQYEGTLYKEVYTLANKLLATEQHNIEDCKQFLGANLETATV